MSTPDHQPGNPDNHNPAAGAVGADADQGCRCPCLRMIPAAATRIDLARQELKAILSLEQGLDTIDLSVVSGNHRSLIRDHRRILHWCGLVGGGGGDRRSRPRRHSNQARIDAWTMPISTGCRSATGPRCVGAGVAPALSTSEQACADMCSS